MKNNLKIPSSKVIFYDMPKLKSPFVRDKESNYLVRNEIPNDMKWVFEDDKVIATEKLNGTNVSVLVQNREIVSIQNRMGIIPLHIFSTNGVIEGVKNAFNKGWIPAENGQYFGELVGPGIQDNLLGLKSPLWIPFNIVIGKFSYRAWGKYPKDFDTISRWFEEDIFSLAASEFSSKKVFPEGIVFHHPDGRMAKLRRDMFDWYTGKRHE